MNKQIYSCILYLIIILFSNHAFCKPPIYINDNLPEALKLSETIKTDVILIFSADWCINCSKMKQDMQKHQAVFDDMIVCIIDIDKNKRLIKEYRVKNIPDCRIIRNNIQIKKRVGYDNIDNFKIWLNERDK